MSAFCKFCNVGQLLRSTRDFRVSWCGHCFAIEMPKAPPRGKDKVCPECDVGMKPEWDDLVLDGRRVVYNLRYTCNECGSLKPWPTDCYFCGAEQDVYDCQITEVIYRGKSTWTRDRVVACGTCLPKIEQGFYDTQVDKVRYAKSPVDPSACVHCSMDEAALRRVQRANVQQGTLEVLEKLLCSTCRGRLAALAH